MRNKSLGKGLNALIPQSYEKTNDKNSIVFEKLENIKPRIDQPRKEFDEESLKGLSESIKKYGLLQPIVITKKGEENIIVAGERRYRASILAGIKEVPVIVKNVTDKELDILSLIENVQRENLSALEEANAYESLSGKYKITQEEIAKAVGKSRSYIANSLRLLKLDENSKKELESGRITSSQARSLLSVDEDKRKEIVENLVNKKMNVRDVEENARKIKNSKKNEDDNINLEKILLEDVEERYTQAVGSKVDIIKNKNKYKIQIEMYSKEDVENLLERLENA
ncbi:MAG: ParB/RepB/Spo0J family partition protein [Peptoniphilaceae bacterium]|nr:ParB/RepB/Spo0J family partition protein [Peptoniphilaceae bacterium]MDY3738542.1 ParB/RepB/Spo0J family partition protein [Peptoniphilaceae bacterium]